MSRDPHRKNRRRSSSGDGGPSVEGDLVIGKRALEELLNLDARLVQRVFVAEGAGRGDRHAALLHAVEVKKIPIEFLSEVKLEELCGSASHQSFVTLRSPRRYTELKEFLSELDEEQPAFVLALDGILDPHNVGAILRAAECFGADLVLWSKNRCCGITPAVTGVSVGASELLRLAEISNLAQTLAQLKDSGFWIVIADEEGSSTDLNEFSFPERTVLVLGAEEQGIQHLIRERADFKVKIPMCGKISSLNVSQAAAILCARYRANNRT